jgi:short-subunit dehydrogenase
VVRQIRDRVCLVTGASSGIGRKTALALAERGATVVVVARREPLLRTLLGELAAHAPQSFFLAGDLADRDFAESIVAECVRRCGRLDVVVNNAAMPMHRHALGVSAEEAEATLRLNFLSPLWTTSAALPHLLRSGDGTIVNVSSFASLVVPPREGVYAASKAALNAWSEGLSLDLAGSGIHVALVHPGPIDTEIWDKRQEPSGYTGKRWPARDVADAIVRVIERGEREVVVPRRQPGLVAARWLGWFAPGLLRRAMLRLDPASPDVFERARARLSQ